MIYSQTIGDQLYDMGGSTRLDAITSDQEFVYMFGTSIDTIFPFYRIGVFYKINIEDNIVVDSVRLTSELLEIDPRANNLEIIGDSLHYLAIGYEFRDTIINGQSNFTFYQKFSYSLNTGEWNLKSIPAYDDMGRQFVSYIDTYFHEDRIYVIGERLDSLFQKRDLLVSCLSIDGNPIWTKAFLDTLARGETEIIVDSNNDLIVGSALIFAPISRDLEEVRYNLSILKLDIENGDIIDSYVGKNLTGAPRAIIEDSEDQSYIIASNNVTPLGLGRVVQSPRIIKLSHDFEEVIWETNISDVAFAYPWHIDKFLKTNDNTFIGVGRAGQVDTSEITLPARMIKITSDGEIIWDKLISRNDGDFRSNWLSDVTPHKEGFVACGNVFDPIDTLNLPIQQGWVVAFDQDGNLDIRSSIDNLSLEPTLFRIFPNPATDVITISCTQPSVDQLHISMYSLDGTLHKTKTVCSCQGDVQLDVSGIPSGLYTIVVRSEVGISAERVFISR